jgi:hypothetical protein
VDDPYHFPDYPAQLLIDLIDGRMAYALTSLDKIPSPLRRLSLIDVMQASGTARLHSHYSLLVSGFLPPVPYLSGFFSPSDKSDPAASIETKSEISGRSVPLSGLPRPATERPHRRSDGLGPNLLGQTIQSPTPAFSHKRYTGIRNSEVSLPLHSEMILNPAVSSDPGSSSLSPIRKTSTHSFPIDLTTLSNSPCTKQIRSCREQRV